MATGLLSACDECAEICGRCLPPSKLGIGSRHSVVPIVGFLWEFEVRRMTITPYNVEPIFSLIVVPLAVEIGFLAICPPRPVALDEFVGRAASDLARFDGRSIGRSKTGGVGRHMF